MKLSREKKLGEWSLSRDLRLIFSHSPICYAGDGGQDTFLSQVFRRRAKRNRNWRPAKSRFGL